MFHFPAFPPHTLYIQVRVTGHESSRVSPFGHPRITARLPAPRGLSQAPTSFIGSWCQGIHRMPLQTYLPYTTTRQHTQQSPTPRNPGARPSSGHPQNTKKMLASTVQFSSNNQTPAPHPTPTPTPALDQDRTGLWKDQPGPEETHPHPTRQVPVPSGPNSVPRPASPPRHPRSPPDQLAVLTDPRTDPRASCRCSTLERPHHHERAVTGHPLDPTPVTTRQPAGPGAP